MDFDLEDSPLIRAYYFDTWLQGYDFIDEVDDWLGSNGIPRQEFIKDNKPWVTIPARHAMLFKLRWLG